MANDLKTLMVLGQTGKLPSGLEWMELRGDIYVYTVNDVTNEFEWVVPVCALLDPADADEIACLGSILNQELNHLKEEATSYGKAWMGAIIIDDEVDEWIDLTWPEFIQALDNANDPSFTWHGGTDTDYTNLEGEFFEIAAEAAWDFLKDYDPDTTDDDTAI